MFCSVEIVFLRAGGLPDAQKLDAQPDGPICRSPRAQAGATNFLPRGPRALKLQLRFCARSILQLLLEHCFCRARYIGIFFSVRLMYLVCWRCSKEQLE